MCLITLDLLNDYISERAYISNSFCEIPHSSFMLPVYLSSDFYKFIKIYTKLQREYNMYGFFTFQILSYFNDQSLFSVQPTIYFPKTFKFKNFIIDEQNNIPDVIHFISRKGSFHGT